MKLFSHSLVGVFFSLHFQMNQQCKVCGEPAAGFHFGAFTCEGCKVNTANFFSLFLSSLAIVTLRLQELKIHRGLNMVL